MRTCNVEVREQTLHPNDFLAPICRFGCACRLWDPAAPLRLSLSSEAAAPSVSMYSCRAAAASMWALAAAAVAAAAKSLMWIGRRSGNDRRQ